MDQFATFCAGCFMSSEYSFVDRFKENPGLKGWAVGHMSINPDAKRNPTVEDVDEDKSHNEVLYLRYDPSMLKYEDLVKHFFTIHDPTIEKRSGNDIGE